MTTSDVFIPVVIVIVVLLSAVVIRRGIATSDGCPVHCHTVFNHDVVETRSTSISSPNDGGLAMGLRTVRVANYLTGRVCASHARTRARKHTHTQARQYARAATSIEHHRAPAPAHRPHTLRGRACAHRIHSRRTHKGSRCLLLVAATCQSCVRRRH